MNKIRTTVVTMGGFFALLIVQGFAADQRTVDRAGTPNNRLNPGTFQGGGVTTKPPVLAQPVFYQCSGAVGQCDCSTAADCGRMGQAGVCKAGSYHDNESGKPGGWCSMK